MAYTLSMTFKSESERLIQKKQSTPELGEGFSFRAACKAAAQVARATVCASRTAACKCAAPTSGAANRQARELHTELWHSD